MKHNDHFLGEGEFLVSIQSWNTMFTLCMEEGEFLVSIQSRNTMFTLCIGEGGGVLVPIQSWNTMFTMWGRGNFLCQCNHESQCSLCAWKRGNFLCQCNHETQCSLCGGGGISWVNTIMKQNVHFVRKGEFLVSIHSWNSGVFPLWPCLLNCFPALTTVEGVIQSAMDGLAQDQPVRKVRFWHAWLSGFW